MPAHHRDQPVVVYCEDDDWTRQYTEKQLTQAGYKVVSFPDGEQSLQYVREYACNVAAVVTDGSMPKLTGWLLRDKLQEMKDRSELPGGTPVVIFSNNKDTTPLCSGLDCYRLGKGCGVKSLIAALQQIGVPPTEIDPVVL